MIPNCDLEEHLRKCEHACEKGPLSLVDTKLTICKNSQLTGSKFPVILFSPIKHFYTPKDEVLKCYDELLSTFENKTIF